MPRIQSSTDLRNHYNEISKYCHETGKPVFITKNGQGDLAVMSVDKYEIVAEKVEDMDKLDPMEELYALLAEGRKDVEEGRTRPYKEAFADLRRKIKNGEI